MQDIKEVWCDGDIWAYQIGFVAQDKNGNVAPWCLVKEDVNFLLRKTQLKFPNAKLIVTLTDEKNNYRKDVAISRKYKGGRKSTKPHWWAEIRKYLKALPNTIVSVNEEADDLMSMALMRGSTIAISTVDKDLNNTQGWHYNDRKEVVRYVEMWEARRKFYTQLLTGDTVDNIMGCEGVGAVKADKILESCITVGEYEHEILMAYSNSGQGEIIMIEMGRLLWMRRSEGEMWNLERNGFVTLEVTHEKKGA